MPPQNNFSIGTSLGLGVQSTFTPVLRPTHSLLHSKLRSTLPLPLLTTSAPAGDRYTHGDPVFGLNFLTAEGL